MRNILLLSAFLFLSFSKILPQNINDFGVYVVDEIEEYKKIIEADSSKRLADLEYVIPGIKLDIKYATEDNFLGKKVYNLSKAYLRQEAADSLRKVQKELNGIGLGLKIFDAYRPYSVTIRFYNEYEDTTFVASPWKGSRHNRGCAVDLTIIDLDSGSELNMPTPYDDFTEKAHVEYTGLTEEEKKNRFFLIEMMEKYGFKVYDYEWWHFDFENWQDFELLDLQFEELQAMH